MKGFLLALLVAFPAAAEDLATPDTPVTPPATEQKFEGRASVEQYFRDKGLPSHVAAGIADNAGRESSFDPTRLGDGGTSGGLFQAHNERFKHLLADIEMDSAWKDVMGRDPVAAAHWNEIKNAPDEKTAARLWAKWFERCSRCGDPGGPPGNSPAGAASSPRTKHSHGHTQFAGNGLLDLSKAPSYGPIPTTPYRPPAAIAPRIAQQPAYTPVYQATTYTPPAYRQPIIQSSAVLALASFFHRRR